jgi:methylsterol monooxygenase
MFVIVSVGILPQALMIGYLIFWVIYHIEHPFFERYKVTSDPWPWNENREEWMVLLKDTVITVAIAQFIINPSVMFVQLYFNNWQVKFDMSLTEFPDRMTMCLQIFFCVVCEDICNFFAHFALHYKPLYKMIHKKHHLHKQPISIVAAYSHPAETIINILCFASGTIILGKRMHHATYILWMLYRLYESVESHSGYEFSFTPTRPLPFAAGA